MTASARRALVLASVVLTSAGCGHGARADHGDSLTQGCAPLSVPLVDTTGDAVQAAPATAGNEVAHARPVGSLPSLPPFRPALGQVRAYAGTAYRGGVAYEYAPAQPAPAVVANPLVSPLGLVLRVYPVRGESEEAHSGDPRAVRLAVGDDTRAVTFPGAPVHRVVWVQDDHNVVLLGRVATTDLVGLARQLACGPSYRS